jgi:hypothetical protein
MKTRAAVSSNSTTMSHTTSRARGGGGGAVKKNKSSASSASGRIPPPPPLSAITDQQIAEDIANSQLNKRAVLMNRHLQLDDDDSSYDESLSLDEEMQAVVGDRDGDTTHHPYTSRGGSARSMSSEERPLQQPSRYLTRHRHVAVAPATRATHRGGGTIDHQYHHHHHHHQVGDDDAAMTRRGGRITPLVSKVMTQSATEELLSGQLSVPVFSRPTSHLSTTTTTANAVGLVGEEEVEEEEHDSYHHRNQDALHHDDDDDVARYDSSWDHVHEKLTFYEPSMRSQPSLLLQDPFNMRRGGGGGVVDDFGCRTIDRRGRLQMNRLVQPSHDDSDDDDDDDSDGRGGAPHRRTRIASPASSSSDSQSDDHHSSPMLSTAAVPDPTRDVMAAHYMLNALVMAQTAPSPRHAARYTSHTVGGDDDDHDGSGTGHRGGGRSVVLRRNVEALFSSDDGPLRSSSSDTGDYSSSYDSSVDGGRDGAMTVVAKKISSRSDPKASNRSNNNNSGGDGGINRDSDDGGRGMDRDVKSGEDSSSSSSSEYDPLLRSYGSTDSTGAEAGGSGVSERGRAPQSRLLQLSKGTTVQYGTRPLLGPKKTWRP